MCIAYSVYAHTPGEEGEIPAGFEKETLKAKYLLYHKLGTSPVFKNIRSKRFVLACMQQAFPDIMDFMNSEYGRCLTMGPIPSILATSANISLAHKLTVTQENLQKLFDAKIEEPLFLDIAKNISTIKATPSPPPVVPESVQKTPE